MFARSHIFPASRVVLGLGVFLVDLRVELGVAVGVAYLLVIWQAYSVHSAPGILIAACAGSVLTLIAYYYSPQAGEPWKALANRGFVLAAIWTTAIAGSRALRIQAEFERLARIVASSNDAIIGMRLDGVVTSWNNAASELFGYRADEMLGQPVSRLGSYELPTEVWKRIGDTGDVKEIEAIRTHKNGSSLSVSSTVSPVFTSDGRLTGASFITRNISKKKKLEQVRLEMTEQLECRVEERTLQLNQANASLERSNAELKRFAYVASHDLQTPLRSITGFAQFLQEEYGDSLDEKARDYIRRIVRGTDRMAALIRDLLELSRTESQDAERCAVNLNELCPHILEKLRPELDESGTQVTTGDLPVVRGNRDQIGQLIQNLVRNAVTYCRAEIPRVSITARSVGDLWEISVQDNGIGIQPEHRKRIFEVFRRLHSGDAYPGTGIGLAICLRIVQAHGGEIWVGDSQTEGSIFHFTLPAVKQ